MKIIFINHMYIYYICLNINFAFLAYSYNSKFVYKFFLNALRVFTDEIHLTKVQRL